MHIQYAFQTVANLLPQQNDYSKHLFNILLCTNYTFSVFEVHKIMDGNTWTRPSVTFITSLAWFHPDVTGMVVWALNIMLLTLKWCCIMDTEITDLSADSPEVPKVGVHFVAGQPIGLHILLTARDSAFLISTNFYLLSAVTPPSPPQVLMKTIPKSSLASRLSPILPPDSGMPSLKRWENSSLLQFSVQN